MQLNTDMFWIISKDNFNANDVAEVVFGATIKQTLLVKKLQDDNGWIGAAKIIGWVNYDFSDVEIPDLSEEVKALLTTARTSMRAVVSPQKELSPTFLRPWVPAVATDAGGVIHDYSEELAGCLRIAFISGHSKMCQFSYCLDRFGFCGVTTWKPEDVVSFAGEDLVTDIEEMIFKRAVENFNIQLRYFQTILPAMHSRGSKVNLASVDSKINLLEGVIEIEARGDKVTDLMHIPRLCSKSEIMELEALIDYIGSVKDGGYNAAGKVVDSEVAKWPQSWKDALVWLGDNTPFHTNFDYDTIDFAKHPILDLFVKVGIIHTYSIGGKHAPAQRLACVRPIAATLLSAVIESLQKTPNVGDGEI